MTVWIVYKYYVYEGIDRHDLMEVAISSDVARAIADDIVGHPLEWISLGESFYASNGDDEYGISEYEVTEVLDA